MVNGDQCEWKEDMICSSIVSGEIVLIGCRICASIRKEHPKGNPKRTYHKSNGSSSSSVDRVMNPFIILPHNWFLADRFSESGFLISLRFSQWRIIFVLVSSAIVYLSLSKDSGIPTTTEIIRCAKAWNLRITLINHPPFVDVKEVFQSSKWFNDIFHSLQFGLSFCAQCWTLFIFLLAYEPLDELAPLCLATE